jgi:hypothetical protein
LLREQPSLDKVPEAKWTEKELLSETVKPTRDLRTHVADDVGFDRTPGSSQILPRPGWTPTEAIKGLIVLVTGNR